MEDTNQGIEVTAGMNDETYGYFISGLRIAIKAAGYKYDKDFAEGIMDPVTLSNNFNRKYRMKAENIEKCAKKLNKDEAEIVLIGKKATEGFERQEAPKAAPSVAPGVHAGWVEPFDVAKAVSDSVNFLAKQSQDESGRKRFWREIFDTLPIAAMVIKDGLVWYQNIKSGAWGNMKGVTLCESCVCPDDCKKQHECPSFQAIETMSPRTGFQYIGEKYYKVDVIPLRNNHKGHKYVIVYAIETGQAPPDDRRGGEERRKTE